MAQTKIKRYLTKSRHMAGLHCPKRLWFTCHDPMPYEDAPAGSPMAVGIEVGQKAWKLFPGGVYVDEKPWEHQAAILRTHELIHNSDAPAIFEGAFEHDGVRIRADILERLPDGSWALHEVKSSGGLKDEHYYDIAVQVHVLQGAGINLSSYGLLHINKNYIRRKNGIDWAKFFKRADLTDGLKLVLEETPYLIAENHRVLRKRNPPEVEPFKHCGDCDYWDRCTANKPADWVIQLPGLRTDQYETMKEHGIEAISDIDDDYPLTGNHVIARQVVLSGQEYVSPDLWKPLKKCGPPAYYLDFETMSPAIPLYPGTGPYQVIAFQWSLHHINRNGKVTHQEYLATGETDPRREFAESLIHALRKNKQPVIVYSAYEKTTLNGLANLFPDLKDDIDAIIDRLEDLLKVTRHYIYHPDFHGSFSIKSVAPALVPNLSYANLDQISDGLGASAGFQAIAGGSLGDDQDVETLRQALLEYCKLDTLALVEVHRALMERAQQA